MRAFHEIAAEYCGWVERPSEHLDLREWLPAILAEMVHAGFSLPDSDCWAESEATGFRKRDYEEVRAALPPLPLQYYREVFEPPDMDCEESIVGDLYDDLADIYGDLSEGLFLFQHSSAIAADAHWKRWFWFHWGAHATSAVRALYWVQRNRVHDVGSEENFSE
ncbi:MAG: hypothetical protein JWQ44_953 [Chthoniobacter sp.]|jgi:hypothetical protein|nr:hypothetical protein [Chthoniobacter sp.]